MDSYYYSLYPVRFAFMAYEVSKPLLTCKRIEFPYLLLQPLQLTLVIQVLPQKVNVFSAVQPTTL